MVSLDTPNLSGEKFDSVWKLFKRSLPFYTYLSVQIGLMTEVDGDVVEEGIKEQVEHLAIKTGQKVDLDKFISMLRGLRYAFLLNTFYEFLSPEKDFTEREIAFIFYSALKRNVENPAEIFEIMSKLFGYDPLAQENLKKFTEEFTDRASEAIPHLIFDVTGGRLWGELHDGLLQIVMQTIELDKKKFINASNEPMTEGEYEKVRTAVSKINLDNRTPEEIFNDIFG